MVLGTTYFFDSQKNTRKKREKNSELFVTTIFSQILEGDVQKQKSVDGNKEVKSRTVLKSIENVNSFPIARLVCLLRSFCSFNFNAKYTIYSFIPFFLFGFDFQAGHLVRKISQVQKLKP